MAQIHALTPEGRLPSQAVAHVQEMITGAAPYAGPWRNIASLMDPAFVSSAGTVRVRRIGDQIEYDFDGIRLIASGSALPWGSLPVGYRPTWNQYRRIGNATGGSCELTVNTGGGFNVNGASANTLFRGGFTIHTTAAPPTTHPGSNA